MIQTYDITILWAPNTEIDLDYYRIYRAAGSGGPYALVGETRTTAFIDRDIPEGSLLYYVITAVDKVGLESAPSAEIVKTSPPDTTPPPDPINLVARGLDDWTGVELFWAGSGQVADIKGYLVYRTFDGATWDIIATTTKPYYKDTAIPLGLDNIYGCTFVAYGVTAYDKYNNVSGGAGPTDFFIIPLIQNPKASIDYLSINVTWKQPRPEDGIPYVEVFYKKKTETAWTLGGAADYPTSKVRIDGPLVKNTEYDVALQVGYYITPIPIVGASIVSIAVSGNYTSVLLPGYPLQIIGSGNQDGTYLINTVVFGGANTIITPYGALPTPAAPLGNVVSRTATFQINELRVIIPDYEQDTTPPTTPTGVVARADPENKRVYVTWNRVAVDDDFLYYEVAISSTIHGKTTDNNYTINNADKYTNSNLIPIYVSAVDRSGNKSTGTVVVVKWYDENQESGTPIKPAWCLFNMPARQGKFRFTNNVEIDLVWNDVGRADPDFDRYFILIKKGANNLSDADKITLFTQWDASKSNIIRETTYGYSNINFNQVAYVLSPRSDSYYFTVGVVSKYGKYYANIIAANIVEVESIDTTAAP